MDKLEDMTEEERKAYFDSIKDQAKDNSGKDVLKGPGACLITQGILTQDEVDAIVNYSNEQKTINRDTMIKTKLDALVSDGDDHNGAGGKDRRIVNGSKSAIRG